MPKFKVLDSDPMVQCPFCGCIDEASVSNEEDFLEYGDQDPLWVVIPVWTCSSCGESWTGHRAEAIRERAVKSAKESK